MSPISPIPSSRTSDLMVVGRLLSQIQTNQGQVLLAQEQLSTGRRIQLPSDDNPAALRGMLLQSLLERKDQVKVNLAASQAYVQASDTSLAAATDLLNDVRATALGVVGTTSTETQRKAAAAEIDAAINQLVSIGNTKFRDRFLYGGSLSDSSPFTATLQGVRYEGNEGNLPTYGDINHLVSSNLPGADIFGGYSPQVRGSVDLNPSLSENTRLADLRGGLGISGDNFYLADSSERKLVRIAGAETVGDVARAIEGVQLSGRSLTARVTSSGLTIEWADGAGGMLAARDSSGAATAAQLGISTPGAPGGQIVGSDLNPRLNPTTALREVGGVRATTRVALAGTSNDLVFEFNDRGVTGNGRKIQFVNDDARQAGPGVVAGSETVEYTATGKAAEASLRFSGFGNDLVLTANSIGTAANNITIQIDASGNLGDAASINFDSNTNTYTISVDDTGETTLDQVVAAINSQGLFTATADPSAGEPYNGASTISAADAGVVTGTTGLTGADADTLLIYVADGSTSANQVIEAVESDATVSALFSVRLDGKDGSASELEGTGRIAAGITATTSGGSGVELDLSSGIQIVNGGQTHVVTFESAETIEDVLNILNGSAANVRASINASGNGIDIRSLVSGFDFSIGENGGQTATHLGVRSFAGSTAIVDLNHGRGIETTAGTDFTIHRRDGVDLAIDVDGAITIQDVLNRINNDAANQDPLTRVVARLATSGNGIELVDENALGTDTLTITRATQSHAAWDLGLIAKGQNQASASAGVTQTITGGDSNPQEVEGVFNTLMRLSRALHANDTAEIERTAGLLDTDLERLTFARAELGLRSQGFDRLKGQLDDESIQLKAQLSDQIDVDQVESILNLTSRQAAYEASLRAAAQVFQLSLLNFL